METDPGVQVLIEEQGNAEAEILDYHSVSRVIFYLRNVPNGIQHMSQLLNGQVETSLNLGILELKEDALTSLTSIRSSVKTRKEDLCARVTTVSYTHLDVYKRQLRDRDLLFSFVHWDKWVTGCFLLCQPSVFPALRSFF